MIIRLLCVLCTFNFLLVFGQDKKVALTTFYARRDITFNATGSGINIGALIRRLKQDPDFNLQTTVDTLYQMFTTDLAATLPFTLLSGAAVTNNPKYKEYEGRFNETVLDTVHQVFKKFIVPEGYKPLKSTSVRRNEGTNEWEMVQIFNALAAGVMFVRFEYDFIKKPFVPFSAGIRINMLITMWDNNARMIFQRNVRAFSSSVIQIKNIAFMSKKDILPLCIESSENLILKLQRKMPRLKKRMMKRL